MTYDLVVADGLLVTPEGTFTGSIGISAGRIAVIAQSRLPGSEVIDARGHIVFPGAVDLHAHFNEPGRTDWEGWGPGSHAAALGGVTTVVEMPLNALPPVTTVEALGAKVRAAQASSVVDFALWGGLVSDNLAQLPALARERVIGFKAFMCESGTPDYAYVDDGILLEGLRQLRALGAFLAVHAENQWITCDRTERLRAQGRRDRRAWGEARPAVAELEAIHRALLLAHETGCQLHIVHLSLPEGATLIAQARAAGQAVTVETCPHYLLLTEEDLVRLGPVAKCAPPLRDQARQDGLWDAVRRGAIDCITSDHSPCPSANKTRGDDDIWAAWGGITGIQTLVPLLLTEGVHRRGLPLDRLATLVAANPARIARLWPRKGALQVGADADMLVVDMAREWRVERMWLRSRHPHSPFVGWPLRGWIRDVLLRGQRIVREGEVVTRAPGQWLRP